MCGIVFIADGIDVDVGDVIQRCPDDMLKSPAIQDFHHGLDCRGPDGTGEHTIKLDDTNATLTFSASLLQLRGYLPPEIPPLIDESSGNILLWNGEIFGGLHVPPGSNDGQFLLEQLTLGGIHAFPSIMSNIRGPWAVVFWESGSNTLWIGRDVFGRRSLLAHCSSNQFLLTSVSPLETVKAEECSNASERPRSTDEMHHIGYQELPPGLYSITMTHRNDNNTSITPYKLRKIEWNHQYVENIARFHRPIELIDPGNALPSIEESSQSPEAQAALHAVLGALRHAVALRCTCIEGPWINNNSNNSNDSTGQGPSSLSPPINDARLLILFSGGVDSTLIAALAHQSIPDNEPIDLATICFDDGKSPDRITSLDAVSELESAFPQRKWRLIGVDKKLKDIHENQHRLIRLLSPSDTVMDLNIGAALWLATEAEGVILNGEYTGRRYKSTARAVLLGHGADELFAGYARCRTRFRLGGWEGLSDELALDVRRLWVRNLGRDDRLVADRGREARHPFLDEGVVVEALKHPLWSLADMRLEKGVGEKRVLRECLRMLGLPRAAVRVKRAIQFGTRLARETNIAHFGGTRQANTKKAGRAKVPRDFGNAPDTDR